MNDEQQNHWMAEVDLGRCAMCQVCVRKCPVKALRSEQRENTLTIFYDPRVCDGCAGKPVCVELCPETAIRVDRLDAPPDDPSERQFQSSELLTCKSCGELYAPLTHAMAAARKGVANADRFKDLCSLCRRTNLVVTFTEEKRRGEAEGQAVYRQGGKLMHKARMQSKRKTDPDQRPPTPEMDAAKGKLPPS